MMSSTEFEAYRDLYATIQKNVRKEFQDDLEDKDNEIKRLKAENAKLKSERYTLPTPSCNNYHYNATLFPNVNGNSIIDLLIELTNSKREKDEYIISKKTDWYMVWKVLRYHKQFSGSEYEFVDIVNDCIKPNIPDTRKNKIAVSEENMKGIKKDNPMKKYPVDKWRNELDRNREEKSQGNKFCGKLALDRGINIRVKIEELMKRRNIKSCYYEQQYNFASNHEYPVY